eukprot:GFUD01137148.1.p1 GENE.GFUD01137148.1~~GFUD01137148.1.p1  ORF type:complete len:109 (+),score=14.90 GFUD01137148.1:96-422(+)
MKSSLFFIFTLSISVTFTQRSSCSSDSQCGTFHRSHCRGVSFFFCFGGMQTTTHRGKCVRRSCGLHNLLTGSTNCYYNECSPPLCLRNSDCESHQDCQNNACVLSDFI